MSSYSILMKTLNAEEGSETHIRLQKLQELEQMRKERELMRQQRAAQNGDTTTSSRLRRARSTTQDTSVAPSYGGRRGLARSGSESDNLYGGNSYGNYGGARPKHSGFSLYSNENENKKDDDDNMSNMFSNITSSILGTSNYGSNYSSYRPHGNQPERSYYTGRTYDTSRPTLTRSHSDSQGDSMLGYSSGYEQRAQLRRERQAARELGNQYNQGHQYNQEVEPDNKDYNETEYSQTDNPDEKSYIETEESFELQHDVNYEEDEEEPKHFIERLKQGHSNGSPLPYKRGVENDYVISNIPSVPPLKRPKPAHSSDVPELVEANHDDEFLAVAKDIRATFGIKSPKTSESSDTQDATDSSRHFEFSSSKSDLNGDSNTNGEFVFTASTPHSAKSKSSSIKRKSSKQSGKKLRNSRENVSTVGQSSETTEDADASVTYEITEVEDDPAEDEGKILPVSDAFNRSAWQVGDHSPGKLDQMHEYFTGDSVNGDPVVNRVLDGRGVKSELDKSATDSVARKSPDQQKSAFSTLKSAFSSLVQSDANKSSETSSSAETTPDKDTQKPNNKSKTKPTKNTPKTNEKNKKASTPKSKKKEIGKNKPVEKVKNLNKSSDSDNDSFQTASESESDYRGSKKSSRATTPTLKNGESKRNGGKKKQNSSEMGLTLSDKLAKLETMTHEKSRKQSIGSEVDGKRAVPSYMSGTSASQKKTRAKSPGGLAKDVRDIKKFVHEQSSSLEASTPVHTPRKQETVNSVNKVIKTRIVKEMSTQTEPMPNDTAVYVCIHCGKSSDQKVGSPVSEYQTDGEDTESLDRYETRSETGYSLRSGKSNSSKSKWNSSRSDSKKVTASSRSYMKGTTSSLLKNSTTDVTEKVRKTSVPEIVFKSKEEDSSKTKKSIVAQRTKELESAAKKGEQKRAAFGDKRTKSVERNKSDNISPEKSRLAKSKSVEHVYVGKGKSESIFTVPVDIEIEKPNTDINSNNIPKTPEIKESDPLKSRDASPGEKQTRAQVIKASPEKEKQKTVVSENVKEGKAAKPPVTAPKPKLSELHKTPTPQGSPTKSESTTSSPRSQTKSESPNSPQSPAKSDEVFDEKVESKGQFTRLENNPFIRNDLHRRNSLKGNREGESVWEKSESRSTSSVEGVSPVRGSSLKRSNTSAGERSSLTNLNWSDSGSSESLHVSKSSRHGSKSSSLHGSFESLNRSPVQRPRSMSTTSNTSQNAMLNLLSPIGTVRNTLTGAMETDVDAAYFEQAEKTDKKDKVEHDEESVERAHLEFAKKACDDMLEFENKKRDSSSDSQDGQGKVTNKTVANGQQNDTKVNGQKNNEDKNGKKGRQKGKKGFLGKMFKS